MLNKISKTMIDKKIIRGVKFKQIYFLKRT